MQIDLHKNARTTPALRQELRDSKLSINELARRCGLTRATVRKWKQRESVEDRSHRPEQLHTTLNPAQEAVVVELRKTLLLPLDDLLAVVREFLHPSLSRSALDRCLRRHGVANLRPLIAPTQDTSAAKKTFKDYEPGFVHMDVKYLPQMPDESRRRYLFVAIDRTTHWVYLELRASKSARAAAGLLHRACQVAPFRITRVLTDNGKEFTDRFCAKSQYKR